MKFFVYIIESLVDNTFYIGQTNNLKNRLKRHNKGMIKSTKAKRPYRLCYFEEYQTRGDAMNREWEIKKKYNTERKTRLIGSFDNSKLTEYLGL
ncbi:MAG TPA: GIY-YIG nuclease family protein [Ignavibacteria bacterium]|jgi:putative endonuclease